MENNQITNEQQNWNDVSTAIKNSDGIDLTAAQDTLEAEFDFDNLELEGDNVLRLDWDESSMWLYAKTATVTGEKPKKLKKLVESLKEMGFVNFEWTT